MPDGVPDRRIGAEQINCPAQKVHVRSDWSDGTSGEADGSARVADQLIDVLERLPGGIGVADSVPDRSASAEGALGESSHMQITSHRRCGHRLKPIGVTGGSIDITERHLPAVRESNGVPDGGCEAQKMQFATQVVIGHVCSW